MEGPIAGQRRYLAARAAAARGTLHENQRAAIDREQALAAAAADLDAYRAASGDLFELTRGAWIDRLVGHARIAAAVDDPWWVEACRVELDGALAARDAGDWRARLVTASDVAAPVRAAGVEAAAAYARLAAAVVWARIEQRPVPRINARSEPGAARQALAIHDGTFDPHALAPRYRWRTPWVGAACDVAASWIGREPAGDDAAVPPDGAAALAAIERAAAAWRRHIAHAGAPRGEGGAGGAPSPAGPGGAASLADVIAPYAALAALAGDAPAAVAMRAAAAAMIEAAAGAATAADALAIWVERGLDVALARAPLLAALAAPGADDADDDAAADGAPDPLLALHRRTLAADLAQARTPTEVDLINVHAQACRAVEADWQRVLEAARLAPARVASIAVAEPSPESAAMRDDARRAAEALGVAAPADDAIRVMSWDRSLSLAELGTTAPARPPLPGRV